MAILNTIRCKLIFMIMFVKNGYKYTVRLHVPGNCGQVDTHLEFDVYILDNLNKHCASSIK